MIKQGACNPLMTGFDHCGFADRDADFESAMRGRYRAATAAPASDGPPDILMKSTNARSGAGTSRRPG